MNEVEKATWRTKVGLAEMLKGGVIMDVTSPEQAEIAEEAGAVAVMALERVPADIRAQGGVARMSDPKIIKAIMKAVSIPVMAKCRIGHFVEAQILEALGVDFIDESEVLTPADEQHHINKHAFKVPFVCGCRDLGEALRRIGEGAAMIRTKGEAGTGNVVEAVRHMRAVMSGIRWLQSLREDELMAASKQLQAPYELVVEVHRTGKLPVPNFSAGGIATPADAALMMQLGAEAVFVGSGIFKSGDPKRRAKAIVDAVTYYNDPKVLAEISEDLGEPMVGIDIRQLEERELLARADGRWFDPSPSLWERGCMLRSRRWTHLHLAERLQRFLDVFCLSYSDNRHAVRKEVALNHIANRFRCDGLHALAIGFHAVFGQFQHFDSHDFARDTALCAEVDGEGAVQVVLRAFQLVFGDTLAPENVHLFEHLLHRFADHLRAYLCGHGEAARFTVLRQMRAHVIREPFLLAHVHEEP
jgi:pyridoxal 5'-phosphate synthase pdxS subunit